MEVIIQPTHEDAVGFCARMLARRIREKPDIVLGLATGRTMEPLYTQLVTMHQNEGLDFSRVTTFNLDEYIGLPPEHEQSYRYYMNHHLFNHVNINQANTHLPNGMAEDIAAECVDYEKRIVEVGGIDLQLLGIGEDGHIGFNEPISSLRSRTRNKTLTKETIAQNSPFFSEPSLMPVQALTVGVGTIMEARYCLMLATGEDKAQIIAQAIEGPITAMVTASALQLHPHCAVIVDEAAAARLKMHDYYLWAFETKPDWEKLD